MAPSTGCIESPAHVEGLYDLWCSECTYLYKILPFFLKEENGGRGVSTI